MLKRLAVAFLTVASVVGCTEGSGGSSAVTVTSSTIVEMYSVEGQSATVDFNTSASWTAFCSADWLSVSPGKGEAGSHTLKLMTLTTNRTKSTRSAQLTITSGSSQKKVTVIQGAEYAVFDQKRYTIGPEGGTLQMGFKSNLGSTAALAIGYSQGDWFEWGSNSPLSRATEWSGSTYPVVFQPNTSAEGRIAAFCLQTTHDNKTWLGLDTAFVYQPGASGDYVSTDYSADGLVSQLQQATAGKGIPIVLMGDGFADKDIADSTYYRVMDQAVENLFSEEPVRSLRDYFDVYSVTAVSHHAAAGSDFTTVFSCVPDYSSSNISFDEEQVLAYLNKVKGIATENALVVVIVNAHTHNGVTALYTNPTTGRPRQQSICLCNIIDHVGSEVFRQVLVHEVIGHGLAKLADEYGYEKNGAITSDATKELTWGHRYGWMQNVDATDDVSSVCWSQFIGNTRFASENIGVYEGAFTYFTGAYRPTDDSMMRNNESPFNAPSRKAIYDKVMELGEGRQTSTIDEFAAFDDQHKPDRWDYSTAATRSLPSWQRRTFAPPQLRAYRGK
ncbi:MAG: hypothetical protein IJ551_01055 [Prevotella sp.]|nr:hypothetical protein [Prevotella sp.]